METMNEERAAIESAYVSVLEGGWCSVKDIGIKMFQAGAAWQRAQWAGVPGLRHTDQWESARVADYNAGWNDRHTAEFSRLTVEQIFDIAEPFGEFRYGDAQGDKRIAFARAIIAALAAAPATPAAQVAVPDVSAMARVLSDRVASACCVDPDDNWAMYGQEYIEDVQAMLAAAHPAGRQEQGEVQRLREALDRAVEICREQGRHWDSDDVIADRNYADHCADLIEQLRAALAASTGQEV